ncbi:hypothetical protein [Flavobacterium gawalongense]|uniref:Uncharacterized protein n=1 Tax=Flavobacterium gawalongense TaxID=2594432 RepID=A0ABY3CJV8_9FLAO|nr:hypothetical protein [Flavobacterium gawalongense]TRW97146.1 hypothetical protein FNW33_16740 [Flavobacterium gawalongense]TRX05354.1 hypothetical protein FNW12_10845 [Flavobacterium gawalongense]
MNAFRSNNSETTPFTHLWAGSDFPIKLKNNTYLLLSPSYEQWHIESANNQTNYPTVQSLSLPIGLILPLEQSKWSLSFIPIVRWNGEKLFSKNTFQYGGVAFTTFAKKKNQKFRLGIYANKEFFGWFVIPLLGTDWRIDDTNYIFGLLPGRLTYEHKWNTKLYSGATFRAPMNSYRLSNDKYIRLDDNQISVYLDYYPAKHLCITLEPGFGAFRKIRTGIANYSGYTSEIDWGDGPFIKLSAAYRIRL